MSHMRVGRKVGPRRVPTPVSFENLELKIMLSSLLTPITSSISVLNETVASLVNAWNRREGHDVEKRHFGSDFNAAGITADMIAADTHRLSKNYSALKDQVNSYQQNLQQINEKLANMEKLLATMVKRQTKKRNIDSTVLDIFQQFEHFLSTIRKDQSSSYTEEAQSQLDESCNGLDTSPMQVLTLNTEDDYPQGSWLGNSNVSRARVRCPLRPDDLIYIHTKCTTPEKMALTLLDYLFSKETLAVSNLSGKSKLGKKKLDPLMIYGIKCHLMHNFSITEKQWEKIKLNIDSKCRTAWKKRRLTPEYCISLEAELYPDDSQSKDSLTNLAMRDECDQPKTRVIRTLQGEIEVLSGDQVLRFQDLHNIHVLDGDHILPIISSDGEDGEGGIPLRRCSEQSHLAIVAEDATLSNADNVSFVMEPMLEVLTEGSSLITEPGGLSDH